MSVKEINHGDGSIFMMYAWALNVQQQQQKKNPSILHTPHFNTKCLLWDLLKELVVGGVAMQDALDH